MSINDKHWDQLRREIVADTWGLSVKEFNDAWCENREEWHSGPLKKQCFAFIDEIWRRPVGGCMQIKDPGPEPEVSIYLPSDLSDYGEYDFVGTVAYQELIDELCRIFNNLHKRFAQVGWWLADDTEDHIRAALQSRG